MLGAYPIIAHFADNVELFMRTYIVLLYRAFWVWHSQWQGKLSKEEIDHYMAIIEKLPIPAEESAVIVPRIRQWAEADDGKPLYMFNLIHYFPQLHTFPGAPDFKGTPQASNEIYMSSLTWLWLSHAAYPAFDGFTQNTSLINIQPERTWGQMTVVRYRNRRTFLKLLSDPAYARVVPYKFMAMELDLVPASPDMEIPDLRWVLAGAFLIVFLLVGWIRAIRKTVKE